MQATLRMLRAKRLFLPRAAARGVLPFVQVDDAAAATIAALEHPSPSAVYNVVDDRPMSLTAFLTLPRRRSARRRLAPCRRGSFA